MKCPICGNSRAIVIDSRISSKYASIRRRKECLSCGGRYITYEALDEDLRTFKKEKAETEKIKKIIRML